MNPDGSGQTNISQAPSDELQPAWQPVPVPAPSVSKAKAKEGKAATFTVTLPAAISASVTYDVQTAKGKAKGKDFKAKDSSLTFAPGETSKKVKVKDQERRGSRVEGDVLPRRGVPRRPFGSRQGDDHRRRLGGSAVRSRRSGYPRDVDLLRLADRSWPFLDRLMRGHVALYRATNGRVGHRFPGAPSMLLLDHVGAKTGTRRTTALAYVEDGPNLVLIASKAGHPKHPAWFHNLRAHPEVEVQVGSDRKEVRARVATPEERARLWPMAVKAYAGYRGYQERTDREIPVVILEPRVPSP